MKELSIEQLAELSANDALGRRIDEKNSASLAHVTMALAGVCAALATKPLIYLLGGVDRRVAPLALALSSLIVALVAMVAIRAIARDDRRMKWLQRRLGAFTGAFLAAEFALMLLAIGVPTTTALFVVYLGYVALYPFIVVLWFRFLTAELILLHGFPFAAAALDTLQIPPNEGAPGDVFVLHSDGVYETADSAGEQYGMERLLRLVASFEGSAAQIRDGILREIARFRGDRPQEDDVTLVVVKIA